MKLAIEYPCIIMRKDVFRLPPFFKYDLCFVSQRRLSAEGRSVPIGDRIGVLRRKKTATYTGICAHSAYRHPYLGDLRAETRESSRSRRTYVSIAYSLKLRCREWRILSGRKTVYCLCLLSRCRRRSPDIVA